jgi:hypothetical protein
MWTLTMFDDDEPPVALVFNTSSGMSPITTLLSLAKAGSLITIWHHTSYLLAVVVNIIVRVNLHVIIIDLIINSTSTIVNISIVLTVSDLIVR